MANKKRPRRHSAGDNCAKKRANVNNDSSHNSQTVDDIIDSVARGDEDDCDSLRRRVSELELRSERHKEQICDLRAQVEFLLSLLGVSEAGNSAVLGVMGPGSSPDPSPALPPYRDITRGVSSRSTRPSLPELSGGGHPTAEQVRPPSSGLSAISKFRTTVAAAVHAENRAIQNRSRNFVISGLREEDGVDDKDVVIGLLEAELSLRPEVGSCKRLGNLVEGRTRKLLVATGSADQATQVLAAAKRLRLSKIEEVRRAVYINADLTRAESLAEYERRCRRRAVQLSKSAVKNNNRTMSTTTDCSAVLSTQPGTSTEIRRLPDSASVAVTLSSPAPAPMPGNVPSLGAPHLSQTDIEVIIGRLLDTARGQSSVVPDRDQQTTLRWSGLDPSAPTFRSHRDPVPMTGESTPSLPDPQ